MSRRPRPFEGIAAPARLTVRDFIYAAGRVSETTPTTVGARRGRASKGQIHLVIDADGGAMGLTADHLRDVFIEIFYRASSGSITSTLRQAMQHLNEVLLEENRRSVRAERRYATVACAVVRDDDVYLATAGRALCFVVGSGGCERFGRGDPKPGDHPVTLLGQDEDIGVDLHHRPAANLSGLILASSGIRDLGDGTFESVLESRHDRLAELVRSLSARHRGRRRFSAAVLTFDGSDDLVEASSSPMFAPLVPPAPAPPRPNSLRDRLFAIPPRRVATSADDAPLPTARPIAGRRPRRPRPAIAREPVTPATLVETNGAHPDPPAIELARLTDDQPRASASPLARVRAIRVPPEATRTVATALALGVLFYVGYLAVQVPARILRQNAEAASALAILSQAQVREQDALNQPDLLARRQMLGEAGRLAAQAAAPEPGLSAVATAQARIQNEYQAASGLTHLAAPVHVVDLPTIGDQLLLVDNTLFVLDRPNSLVYSYLLNVDGTLAASTANPVLVRGGDRVGQATVGNMSQVVWMPAGSGRKGSSLLVLDTAGFMLQYEPTSGLSLLGLATPGAWSRDIQLRGYNGNLFALDRSSHRLTVYQPQLTGYDGDSTSYFDASTTVDLSDATTFAVDQDLFLVHSSGRIERFTDGKSDSFGTLPDDLTPSNPIGIALNDRSIVVGDPRNARVIQLSRAGQFEHAFSTDAPSTLTNLRDLALTADGRSLYVLSGQTIFRFALPE